MFRLRLEDAFIQQLSGDTRKWLGNTMTAMLVADGAIGQAEMPALRDALSLLETQEETVALMEKVKTKETIEIVDLKDERNICAVAFFFLSSIIVMDGKVTKSEAEMFKKVGGNLGFSRDYARQVLEWATEQMKLNKRRNAMIEEASGLRAQYS
ncbi:MAG TPA: hypothetical protein EYG15_00395 [Deltaproteobacteria bacterium]|nr:hypothetical protein [Deltaproteobacteria bacterium]